MTLEAVFDQYHSSSVYGWNHSTNSDDVYIWQLIKQSLYYLNQPVQSRINIATNKIYFLCGFCVILSMTIEQLHMLPVEHLKRVTSLFITRGKYEPVNAFCNLITIHLYYYI